MPDAAPERRVRLAATLAPLGDAEEGLDFISRSGFEAVQLSASQPGLRPRELDGGARRALRERLRRLELEVGGVDLWIPPEHFVASEHAARAVDAMRDALAFAELLDRAPLSCALPQGPDAGEVRAALLREADRRGVAIADFAEAPVVEGPVRLGLDVASIRARGGSVLEAVALAGASLGAVRLSLPGPAGGRRPFTASDREIQVLREVRLALEAGGVRTIPVADARGWPDPRGGLASTRDAWFAAALVDEEAPRWT